jgi:hypothetical protein
VGAPPREPVPPPEPHLAYRPFWLARLASLHFWLRLQQPLFLLLLRLTGRFLLSYLQSW